MTKKQKENLRILANYLLKGELKAKFSMTSFDDGTSGDWKSGLYKTDCDSVGCAVGHGPYAGIAKNEDEMWNDYIKRVFDNRYYEDDKDGFDVYEYCFSDKWTSIDNSPQGAGKRILSFLENDEAYQEWCNKGGWSDDLID